MSDSRPLVVAHRAGNELSALRHAASDGADVVEADIWFYRGQLEVRHLKTMGPIPLLWDRWRLAPGWTQRLTLPRLLAAAGSELHLMLDLKGGHPRLPQAAIAAMREYAPGRRYLVCSQWWDSLDPFRHVPEAGVVHSVGNTRALGTVTDMLTWHDRHAISIHKKLLAPAVVERLRQHAPLVMSWPVNDEATLDLLTGWGVNGVITDDPHLVRQVAAAPGSPPELP